MTTTHSLTFYKLSAFFGLATLKRVDALEIHDFASFAKISSKTSVDHLNQLTIDANIFHESMDFKSFVSQNNQFETNKLESLALKIKTGLDCLVSTKDVGTFKKAFRIDASTSEIEVKNIVLEFASHFKIHGNRTHLLCGKIIKSLFDDYSITIGTSAEIENAYNRFQSCMQNYAEKMPLFYGAPYNTEEKISIGVLIFWHNDIMRGRAVYRLQSNKIASFYGYDRVIFNALSKKLGYKIDCDALIGARLPIVVDDNGALLIPYIDCSNKQISLKLDEHGNYLVIGTKKDDLVLLGSGDSQRLQLNDITANYHDYFSDNYVNTNTCSNCDCDVDDHYSTTNNGDILCEHCAGYCEQCDETVIADNMVQALSEQRGSYYRIYVCECCADNADHMAVF
jgi:hypothetical protein